MTQAVIIGLQILALLIRAWMDRNDASGKALQSLKEAQNKLREVATQFEEKVRFANVDTTKVDAAQDFLDEERKKFKDSQNATPSTPSH